MLTEAVPQPTHSPAGRPTPPGPRDFGKVVFLEGIVLSAASADLRLAHLPCPDHPIVPDPIVRLARMVPIANRRLERDQASLFRQLVFGLAQRCNDLGTATAATAMTGGAEFF